VLTRLMILQHAGGPSGALSKEAVQSVDLADVAWCVANMAQGLQACGITDTLAKAFLSGKEGCLVS